MSISQNKNKRAVILIMIALSLIVLTISYLYYKRQNSFKDPRIKHARELYEKYNEYAVQNDFNKVFSLIDSIENIYTNYSHFSESFEIGVLYNNKAASYLTMALHNNKPESFSIYSKDTLLNFAYKSVTKSINIYENWLNKFDNKTPEEIKDIIQSNYFEKLEHYSKIQKQHFLENRIEELTKAQIETKRRLSVSYTNMGIIYRHKEDYKNAIIHYQKAIELWDRNLTAENNLNILLGRPLKKRNLIQKLFPPKKEESK